MANNKKAPDFSKPFAKKEVSQAEMKQIYTNYNLEDIKKSVSIQFRVRFSETDSMGVVWHGNYFSWFEMGRIEHLRQSGISYREVVDNGYLFAVVHADCDFKHPAHYDDLLTLTTAIERVTPVRIFHVYKLYCGEQLLATGHTTVVSLDHNGMVRQVPESILNLSGPEFKNKKI